MPFVVCLWRPYQTLHFIWFYLSLSINNSSKQKSVCLRGDLGIRDKENGALRGKSTWPPSPIKQGSRGTWIAVWSIWLPNPRFVVKPCCLPKFGINKTLNFIMSWNYVPRSEMTKSGAKRLSCSKNIASYDLGRSFPIVPSDRIHSPPSSCSETPEAQPHAPIFQLPCPLASGWAGGESSRYSLLCSACGLDSGCGLPPLTHGCWLQSSLVPVMAPSHPSPFRLLTAGLAPLLRVPEWVTIPVDSLNSAHSSLNTLILSLEFTIWGHHLLPAECLYYSQVFTEVRDSIQAWDLGEQERVARQERDPFRCRPFCPVFQPWLLCEGGLGFHGALSSLSRWRPHLGKEPCPRNLGLGPRDHDSSWWCSSGEVRLHWVWNQWPTMAYWGK